MAEGGGSAPIPPAGKPAGRQRRIRNWALLVALLVLAGVVYGVAMVRMIQQHQLPHFY